MSTETRTESQETTQPARDLPADTYITINRGLRGGWYGYAHVCGRRVATREAWQADHPEITREPHELEPEGGAPYWLASWQDSERHETPIAACAAIVELVLADVRPS